MPTPPRFRPVVLLLLSLACISCTERTSWKEEVVLHDGRKLLASRQKVHSGMGEIGHGPPITSQELVLQVDGSTSTTAWRTEGSWRLDAAPLAPIAVEVVNGVVFLVASTTVCGAYDQVGRPNPPYLVFRHHGQVWERIAPSELPLQVVRVNLLVDPYRVDDMIPLADARGVIPEHAIAEWNGMLSQPHLRSILRAPLAEGVLCPQASNDPRWRPKPKEGAPPGG